MEAFYETSSAFLEGYFRFLYRQVALCKILLRSKNPEQIRVANAIKGTIEDSLNLFNHIESFLDEQALGTYNLTWNEFVSNRIKSTPVAQQTANTKRVDSKTNIVAEVKSLEQNLKSKMEFLKVSINFDEEMESLGFVPSENKKRVPGRYGVTTPEVKEKLELNPHAHKIFSNRFTPKGEEAFNKLVRVVNDKNVDAEQYAELMAMDL